MGRFLKGRIPVCAANSIAMISLAATPSAALAYDWAIDGHVVVIETTYVGSTNLFFSIDQSASASCPAGTWIMWNTMGSDEPARLANVQAQLSVLQSAKMSGRTIRVYGNNSNCSASYLWSDG